MTCIDHKIRELIFNYWERSVTTDQKVIVEGHLKRCSDCRQLLGEYGRMGDGLREYFSIQASSHPDNISLVALSEKSGQLGKTGLSELKLHLAVCDQCRSKLEMLTQVEKEMNSRPSGIFKVVLSRIRHWFDRPVRRRWLPAAIGIGLLAIMLSTWLIERQPTELLQFSHRSEVSWLKERMRGQYKIPMITAESRFIDIGLPITPFFDEETYVVELRSPSGTRLASLPVSEEDYEKPGIRICMLTSELDKGSYWLVVLRRDKQNSKLLGEASFQFELMR